MLFRVCFPCWALVLGGCAAEALRPGFERLRPKRIAVLPVANATLLPLEDVSFAGTLQSFVGGVERHNIPDLLRGALEETLLLAGYDLAQPPEEALSRSLDYRQPLPSGTAPPDFQAAVSTTIVSWRSSRMPAAGFSMRFRVGLHHVPSGEALYDGEFRCEHASDARTGGSFDVASAIRRCARQALAALPEAGAMPPAGPGIEDNT